MSDWLGSPDRECGQHRTTGSRAWCFDCREWCHPEVFCQGCVDGADAADEQAEANYWTSLDETGHTCTPACEDLWCDGSSDE